MTLTDVLQDIALPLDTNALVCLLDVFLDERRHRGLEPHLVHHVANGDLAVEIHDAERSAPASPEADASRRQELIERRLAVAAQSQSDAPANVEAVEAVDAAGLLLEYGVDGVLGQELAAVAGERHVGEQAGAALGVSVAVGGANLGAPPGRGVGKEGVGEGVEDLDGDRVLGHGADVEGRRRRQLGGSAPVLLLASNLNVGAVGLGQLLGDELLEARAGDAADHLADQVAVYPAVVAGHGTGLPERCLLCQVLCPLLEIDEAVHGQRLLPAGDSRAVGEDVADLNVLLAVGGELGPVLGDLVVDRDAALVHELQHGQSRDDLGAGEHVDNGVLLPWLRAGRVCVTSVYAEDILAVEVDGQRGAVLLGGLDVLLKGIPDALELGVVVSADLSHGEILFDMTSE